MRIVQRTYVLAWSSSKHLSPVRDIEPFLSIGEATRYKDLQHTSGYRPYFREYETRNYFAPWASISNDSITQTMLHPRSVHPIPIRDIYFHRYDRWVLSKVKRKPYARRKTPLNVMLESQPERCHRGGDRAITFLMIGLASSQQPALIASSHLHCLHSFSADLL